MFANCPREFQSLTALDHADQRIRVGTVFVADKNAASRFEYAHLSLAAYVNDRFVEQFKHARQMKMAVQNAVSISVANQQDIRAHDSALPPKSARLHLDPAGKNRMAVKNHGRTCPARVKA